MRQQIKSRERVEEHGEVFTSDREVNAMLDLVYNETQNIESRFLEPACGDGNFLIKILERKLSVVEKKYKKSQSDFEKWSFIAISSLYGIDLLEDNILECRDRLYEKFLKLYEGIYKKKIKYDFLNAIRYVLDHNLLVGDALTMKINDDNYIVFPEWSFVKGNNIRRRDYIYKELIREEDSKEIISVENKSAFIPEPIKEYPLINYIRVVEYE